MMGARSAIVIWTALWTPSLVAQASSASVLATSANPEKDLYNAVAGSVFRVESGIGHGTGFLVDSSGLVLTNDHVIGAADEVTVYVEPTSRFLAKVVQRDADADIAVLRLAPRTVAGRSVLRLADLPVEIGPGDRIIALGFPLHQPLTMSAGMVANLRPGAILTDAILNPGNSGGPIFTLDGRVVAITTFGDLDGPGPGLGGGVLVDRALKLLETARKIPEPAPSDRPLPTFPWETYPKSILKAIADTIDPLLFTSLSSLTAGPFAISVSSPLAQALSAVTTGRHVSKDRRRREERANVPLSQRYSDPEAWRNWRDYVGEETAPVVSITVQPLIGETGGSAFRRGLLTALVGVGGQATLRFQGDVRGVVLRRNGQVIEPLRGGHVPLSFGTSNELVDFSDVADFGYYVYSPEAFRPDAPQRPPTITPRNR